ncbi:MAG TPA: hypothetical protein VK395_23340 [Gemmataceae bacterium]|nr:hypothetical protein [Gemmataceae bacterium]
MNLPKDDHQLGLSAGEFADILIHERRDTMQPWLHNDGYLN